MEVRSVSGGRGSDRRQPGAVGAGWLLLWLLLLCVCAGPAAAAETAGEASEVAEVVDAAPHIHNPDPWEPFNRGLFQLNEWGDIFLVRPVAAGWRFITPTFLRSSVTNFNDNLQMPVILGNNILQLKPVHVRDDILRMIFNLSFGLAGLLDVASAVDIPQNDEDFGQTLGYWGTPSGPYLVLPVYGPSTVRDGVGRLADSAGTFYFSFLPLYSTLGVRSLEVVNLRAEYFEEIDANRAESFDYYVFLRNAYLQNRRTKIDSPGWQQREPEPETDLYHLDDEEDDGFEYDDDEDYDTGVEEDFDA